MIFVLSMVNHPLTLSVSSQIKGHPYFVKRLLKNSKLNVQHSPTYIIARNPFTFKLLYQGLLFTAKGTTLQFHNSQS